MSESEMHQFNKAAINKSDKEISLGDLPADILVEAKKAEQNFRGKVKIKEIFKWENHGDGVPIPDELSKVPGGAYIKSENYDTIYQLEGERDDDHVFIFVMRGKDGTVTSEVITSDLVYADPDEEDETFADILAKDDTRL